MVRYCVPDCRSAKSRVKTYVLPKEKERRIKWCLAICRLDLIDVHPSRRHDYRVCELHFTPESLYASHHNKTDLKYDSVPTLSLPGLQGKWMDTDEMMQPEDGTSMTVESQFEELGMKQSFDVSDLHPGSSMTAETQFEELDIKQSFDEDACRLQASGTPVSCFNTSEQYTVRTSASEVSVIKIPRRIQSGGSESDVGFQVDVT
ncbi:hypothetical protein WN55_07932 [Dufourea novaeangliae]|uniref:THAP-type domain-containing protein n=1 Tax=Dufourea novaeangliae TaxID=178035 RepID=A0A154P6G9_DUFNO|nr:hypothetical protein WN55_07932 [Dufourea novaeangliae]